MCWHREGRNNDDDVLKHPVDACQWEAIDSKFKDEFADDPRNVMMV